MVRIQNFGRNVVFKPSDYFVPRNEEEVFAVLLANRGRRIRTIRLHSWSEATISEDVLLDLRHFDGLQISDQDRQSRVTVGAGCQIKQVIDALVPWTIVRGWKVVDKSQRMLTMEHELFRHIEIEVFVKLSRLGKLLEFVHLVLLYCDGRAPAISDESWSQLETADLKTSLQRLKGRYTHHYPICIRKVQSDDTLISMASSEDEPYYAVSFINCNESRRRDEFLEFASLLARATALLYDARPHWGKVCPIDSELAEQLYPQLPEFRHICNSLDPGCVFRNSWVDELVFGRKPIAAPESPT